MNVVLPKSVLGQLNMEREIKINAEKGIVSQMFHDPEKAMAWLDRQ